MAVILNHGQLTSHGNREGRRIAVDVIEHALKAVDAYEAVKKLVRFDKRSRTLVIGNISHRLGRRLYVIGAGKATLPIARALDEILGGEISDGIVIVKRGQRQRLRHIRVLEAGHPLPDDDGFRATKKIMKMAETAEQGDLVLCIVTGGASALMPVPVAGITLREKRKTTELLLNAGVRVEDVNCVRNHISAVKGGRLARLLHPAKVINFIVIDEIAGLPWGPTVPDETTFRDAVNVLRRNRLWKRAPASVRNHLRRGLDDPSLETLKDSDFRELSVRNVILADNSMMCKAAKTRARQLGCSSAVLTTVLRGESAQAGYFLGSIAKEIDDRHTPLKAPCVLVLGGETTVEITGKHGKGGPSQELALAASLGIEGHGKIVVASIDTDGTDGPTDVAGAISDGYTVARGSELGIDILESLRRHDAYTALTALGNTIKAGTTGTNLMDLDVVVVTD